jgi:sec-independent protein translocase protein TatA
MWGIGFWQMLFILIIFLVLFGPGKLPDLGSSMGKAIRNFKKELSENEENEEKKRIEEETNE